MTSLSDDATFSPSGLRLSSLNLDSPSLADSSGAWDLTHFALLTNLFPYSLHSLLLSLLFPCCFLLSSVPYSLHFPTLQLSTSHYIFIVFTSLLSWHLYSLHLYSLHISTLFTSFLLHISTLYPPLQSSHLYRPCNGVQASYCRASHTGQAIRVMYSSVSVGVVHVLGTCTQV